MKLRDVYGADGEPFEDAVEHLFRLLAQRPREANISHEKMPSIERHREFVRSRPYRAWFIVCEENPIGAVYVTRANEIGVAVLLEHQRKGYAEAAVLALMDQIDPLPVGRCKFLANVAPGNWKSKALFEKKLGGRIVQLTYELPRGEGDGKSESA